MKKFSKTLSIIGFVMLCITMIIIFLLGIQVFIDLVVLKKNIFYHTDLMIYSAYIAIGSISGITLFCSSIINAVIIHSRK
ncbi:MAG: hypothetical protein IJ341_02850 [Bacteroidales bacterium]|nr:hypothetical protein [Bacteroidales bacterium]